MKENRKLWLVLVLCILLAACGGREGVKDECIGTFEEFLYFGPEWDRSVETEKVLPLPPWQFEAYFPQTPEWRGSKVAIARSYNGQNEVWIRQQYYIKDGSSVVDLVTEFLIYRPASKEWETISASVEGTLIDVFYLFLGRDGTLWGWNYVNYFVKEEVSEYPVLSKLNNSTGEFEFEYESLTISPELVEYVLFDSQGLFWIFVNDDGIYSYDPATQRTKKHTDLKDFDVDQAVLVEDGTIFLKMHSFAFELEENELFQFFPSTGELVPLKIPGEPWPQFYGMLVDQAGRLWLSAVGYRDTDGSWHLIHPDPDRYFEVVRGDGLGTLRPRIIFESSDGVLWFGKYSDTNLIFDGLVWYDPETGEGCQFTNLYSSIIEDTERTLWLVADGKLYRYALGK